MVLYKMFYHKSFVANYYYYVLDVVFNHTVEGSDKGPTISLKGLDNSIYYMLSPDKKEYMNYSGCGNTLNCNHPIVRNLIIDCMHIIIQTCFLSLSDCELQHIIDIL